MNSISSHHVPPGFESELNNALESVDINLDIPKQNTWYEPRAIYTGATIDDNTQAFYGLASVSIDKLTELQNMQPNLY